jgi:hypothetical protein
MFETVMVQRLKGTVMRAMRIVIISLFFAISIRAAQPNEFSILKEEASKNGRTKAGRTYEEQAMAAMMPVFSKALQSCNRSTPDTVEPAMFVVVVAADGTVAKVLFSPGIRFGECVGTKLRQVKRLPRPPRDSWAFAFGAANHYHEEVAKGPPDKPLSMTRKQLAELEKVTAPHIAKARATYPAAKKRFLVGLPAGYRFSIQVPLYDRDGIREDPFILVKDIKGGNVTGEIQSKLIGLKDFKTGQRITVPESKITNWVILRPDGVEEGNYVGKFLDHYKIKE